MKPPDKNLHITETVLIYIGYLLNAGFFILILVGDRGAVITIGVVPS